MTEGFHLAELATLQQGDNPQQDVSWKVNQCKIVFLLFSSADSIKDKSDSLLDVH